MREFKFKAWDNGKMHNVSFNNLTVNEHHPSGVIYLREEMKPFGESHITTLMQFTGQHDHKDTPIYESDVVKGKYWINGKSHRFIGSIEYIGSGFRAKGVKQYEGMVVDFNPTFEVIGNIYENPELLKEETK